jgi:hypothetical protein
MLNVRQESVEDRRETRHASCRAPCNSNNNIIGCSHNCRKATEALSVSLKQCDVTKQSTRLSQLGCARPLRRVLHIERHKASERISSPGIDRAGCFPFRSVTESSAPNREVGPLFVFGRLAFGRHAVVSGLRHSAFGQTHFFVGPHLWPRQPPKDRRRIPGEVHRPTLCKTATW